MIFVTSALDLHKERTGCEELKVHLSPSTISSDLEGQPEEHSERKSMRAVDKPEDHLSYQKCSED